jgi:MarR family transcriptional regulator, organic hydroperoxide resistance regulator
MKTDDCIFFQLAKASQTGTKFLNSKVSSLNITPVQAMILGFLGEEDQVMASELGKKVELDSATLTGILDRLETANLIERKGNPNDRRSVKIHLTKQGRDMGREAGKLIGEANQEFLATFSQEEKLILRSLIKKVRQSSSQSN